MYVWTQLLIIDEKKIFGECLNKNKTELAKLCVYICAIIQFQKSHTNYKVVWLTRVWDYAEKAFLSVRSSLFTGVVKQHFHSIYIFMLTRVLD